MDAQQIYWQVRLFFSNREFDVFDNINKAILFTSLPILGMSIVFLHSAKNFVTDLYLLKLSGLCLISAVCSVILTYWVNFFLLRIFSNVLSDLSNGKKDITVENSIEENMTLTTALIALCWFALSILSSLFYLSGVILTALFVYHNIPNTPQ